MSQLLLDDLSAGLLPGRVADGFGVGGASRGSEVVEEVAAEGDHGGDVGWVCGPDDGFHVVSMP